MFSMLFYDIINSLDFKWNRRLAIFSFAVYFIFIFSPYTKEGAIVQGCYFAATGMLAVIIYNIFHNYISLRLTFVLFIIGSILMTIPLASSFSIPLMPFIAFFFLWEISKRYKRYLYAFETLGKISLWIYLIHPLMYQVLIRLIPPLKPNILYGCVILIITIPVSVFVANIINSFLDMIRIAKNKINTHNANN